ncbi:MAG: Rieske 2Fe-2S domain-containing protein [Phycisphaerae bacterium]|nr:Rieske 2Fe-2S domain-containing protein [Saprospiraceae bacterium]
MCLAEPPRKEGWLGSLLNRDETQFKQSGAYNPIPYEPGEQVRSLFGMGAFGCIAKQFSIALATNTVGTLLQRYDFQLLDLMTTSALPFPNGWYVVAAHGGKVEGETIRCPFHGFCFDSEGSCTKTAYGSTPPSRAKLGIKPIHEINGLLLVYNHAAGEAPDWFGPSFEESQISVGTTQNDFAIKMRYL